MSVPDRTARFSIEFLDTGNDARFQDELLGVSYLISCVRQFANMAWSPDLIRSTCSGAEDATKLETIFEAPVHYGAEVRLIDFGATLLATKRPDAIGLAIRKEPDLPSSNMCREEVSALLAISFPGRHPKNNWVASKLGCSENAHFTRTFRSWTGTLSTEFRKMHGQ